MSLLPFKSSKLKRPADKKTPSRKLSSGTRNVGKSIPKVAKSPVKHVGAQARS